MTCDRKIHYTNDDYEAYYTHEADGVASSFAYPRDYLRKEDWNGQPSPYLFVYVDGNGPLAFAQAASASELELGFIPTAGSCVKIIRDSLVNGSLPANWENGSNFTADEINLMRKQHYFALQELRDQQRDNSVRIEEELLYQGPALTFTGDGVTTAFRLEDGDYSISDVADHTLYVHYNGAYVFTEDYSLTDDGDGVAIINLGFTPAAGSKIQVRVSSKGQAFIPQIDDNSITPDKILKPLIDGMDWFNMDDVASERSYLGWRNVTGTWVFNSYALVPGDISGLRDWAIQIRLNEFYVPNGPVTLGGYKLTNVAHATDDSDAPNWGQVQDAIAAIVDDEGGGGSSQTYEQTVSVSIDGSEQAVDIGFAWDWIDIRIVSGNPGASGGAGFFGPWHVGAGDVPDQTGDDAAWSETFSYSTPGFGGRTPQSYIKINGYADRRYIRFFSPSWGITASVHIRAYKAF